MSDDDTIEFNNDKLVSLIKAFSDKMPVCRVGILANKNGVHRPVQEGKGAKYGKLKSYKKMSTAEVNSLPTIAEVGAKHEYGADKLPIRSFLRMPITMKLNKKLEEENAFDIDNLKEIIKIKSMKQWMKAVGFMAEEIISDAFDSGGFGMWKPSNMSLKENHQTLVETQQLRDSITSEVK